MNLVGIRLYPNLLEESWCELERERERERRIREARAARRAERPSRFATLMSRLQSTRRRPVAADCSGACPEPA
jgi:hypothetical protein